MNFILVLLFLFSSFNIYALSFTEVDTLVETEVEKKTLPGGVLLIGDKNKVIHHQAFHTALNTIYDVASLTKLITAMSILILEEEHKLRVSDKLSKYYSEFHTDGKNNITIENLLRHNSGVAAVVKSKPGEQYQAFIQKTLSLPLHYRPGEKTVYSDVGFIILGDLVQKVSGLGLDEFTSQKIFKPLGMLDTGYAVSEKNRSRCAPTALDKKCIVHDPKASHLHPYPLGHAGVFSTTNDLSKLAVFFLHRGVFQGVRLLKEVSVRKMSVLGKGDIRGMGFDLLSPYANPPRGEVFPEGVSYGHTGFTGTTFWIDPLSESYYIFLSNRVLLGEQETARPFTTFRRKLSTMIGEVIYKGFNLRNNKAANETARTEVKTK